MGKQSFAFIMVESLSASLRNHIAAGLPVLAASAAIPHAGT
jgi:hypothetical protein